MLELAEKKDLDKLKEIIRSLELKIAALQQEVVYLKNKSNVYSTPTWHIPQAPYCNDKVPCEVTYSSMPGV